VIRIFVTIAAIVLCGAGAEAVARTPVQRWIDANTKAIARIHDPKRRLLQERIFLATRTALVREQTGVHNAAPPLDPKRLARTIVANARLYPFTQASVQQRPTWWQRVLDWIGDRWSRVLHALFGRVAMPAAVGRSIADALLGACIVVFLALLARVAWVYGRTTRSVSKSQAILPPEDASSLVAQSMKAAQNGDYSLAMTRLFAAALALLAARRQLESRRSETLGEIGRRVRSSDPRLSEPFHELTRMMTRTLYAERPLAPADWSQSLGAFRQLEALL